jgi:formate dehydrogenase subunit gamma
VIDDIEGDRMKRVATLNLLPDVPDDVHAAVLDVTGRLKDLPGALLPVLHGVQKALGYVPDSAVPVIASELNLSRADVHGVITFYHFFRRTAPGKHTIYVCRAESCQAMGALALEQHIKQRLGIDFHETTPNGTYSLEPVYCLGNCACSPAIMVDEALQGRVTPARFDAWLATETKV